MAVYVGEQYLPGTSAEQVKESSDRLRSAAAELAAEGIAVRLVATTFVPQEEWVLGVFEAEVATHVERVYTLAGASVERVTEAIHQAETASTAPEARVT
jgi:hypothetical protein